MPSLFGLFGNRDRRPARSRSYMPTAAPPRRYEVQRPEPSRPSMPPPRRAARGDDGGSWRHRGAVALASVSAIAVIAGAVMLFRSDLLRVRVIDVNGAQVADPQAVASASALAGSSLLTLDLSHASREIAKLPAVKSATVVRAWPQGVRIDITEHQAWGYWQAGPQRLVIDQEGHVLEQSRPPAVDAPTIVEVATGTSQNVVADEDTVQLVNRLRTDGTFDRLQVKPTSYVFRRDRGLTVIVANGPSAVLGDSSNYDFKVRTWQALLDQVRAGRVPQVQVAQTSTNAGRPASSSAVSEIDLRFGRNVVLR